MIAGVPYDAEVEWIGSVKPSYIDTGIRYLKAYTVVLDMAFMNGSSNLDTGLGSSGDAIGTLRVWPSVNQIQFYWYGGFNTMTTDGTELYERHLYEFGPSGIFFDGNQKSQYSSHGDSEKSLKLAGYNEWNTERQGACRFWSFKIYNGNAILMDLIPVRFTNELGQSEGAMYDRVSRKLFRNAGTGAFVVGPDVAKPVMALRRMSLIQSLKTQFRRVKYITCASGDVWFPTGIYNTDEWTLDSITKYGSSSTAVMFGAKYSQTYWSGYGLNLNYGASRAVHGDQYSGYFSIDNVDGIAVHCECTASGCSVTWGEVTHSITSSAGLNGEQIYLLGNGNYTSKSGCMGETKITRRGILLAHLFPCARISDGVPVFYDLVSNRAITNTGTGTAGVIEFS